MSGVFRHTEMRRHLFYVCLLLLVSTISAEKNDNALFRRLLALVEERLSLITSKDKISFLTWNILAPISVNITSLNETGAVDLNLLDPKIRLRLAIHKILETDADIVNLQEVQIDTYNVIRESISDVYGAVPFAAHEPGHWSKPGREDVANGVATFYKRSRISALSNERFVTSENGNAALGNVFRRINSESLTGPPIVLVNCHFHHVVSIVGGIVRVKQGSSVIKWASEMKENLQTKFPSEEPVVIITGDFNSMTGFPGVEYIKGNGYADARDITNNTSNTVQYPEPLITTFFPPLLGLPIDTFFVSESEIKSGRVQIQSLFIPDLQSREFDEYDYVKKVMKIFLDDFKKGKVEKEEVARVMLKLYYTITDGEDYDSLYNRAMRLGSDHLPIVAIMKIGRE